MAVTKPAVVLRRAYRKRNGQRRHEEMRQPELSQHRYRGHSRETRGVSFYALHQVSGRSTWITEGAVQTALKRVELRFRKWQKAAILCQAGR